MSSGVFLTLLYVKIKKKKLCDSKKKKTVKMSDINVTLAAADL